MPLIHPFEPIFDASSRILILGTFPSIKSREYGFYYGHPQNRFWKVIAHITQTDSFPETVIAKKQMLLTHKIALADALQSCDIKASGDSSIKNTIPMNLLKILNNSHVDHIYANGEKAYQLAMKYFSKNITQKIFRLPSTSSANAKYSLEKLILEWKIIST
ncbi:MAG: DNA-deoxyinosine glycosylase [Holosporaceae bacterium]|jgi:hypoxanthine-DNA glycosylase|nr:DNA-deoxyinosine glycosylase [Holosporaceae bacterium]